jgi:hypothetical protein
MVVTEFEWGSSIVSESDILKVTITVIETVEWNFLIEIFPTRNEHKVLIFFTCEDSDSLARMPSSVNGYRSQDQRSQQNNG